MFKGLSQISRKKDYSINWIENNQGAIRKKKLNPYHKAYTIKSSKWLKMKDKCTTQKHKSTRRKHTKIPP